jgi:hypothetical protein
MGEFTEPAATHALPIPLVRAGSTRFSAYVAQVEDPWSVSRTDFSVPCRDHLDMFFFLNRDRKGAADISTCSSF